MKVTNIRKTFGGVTALDGVNMEIDKGKMTMLIGPNGSGKTTLINVVSGFYKPDEGQVLFEGRDITGKAPNEVSRQGLIRTFQVPAPFIKLSVMENLLLASEGNPGESFLRAPLRSRWIKKESEIYNRAGRVLELLNLRLPDQLAGELSGGQLKLLEVGRALMTNARMVALDEPASGLNPTLAHKIFEHLDEIKRDFALTLLIIEHRLDIALQYVDYVYAMANGSVISHGKGEEVMNDPKVIEGYLGGTCT
ncbi:MAG: branched-chain amino acid transport system ATP-binding protein [Thermoproteota archaeon]|nr:branched-chain amino acid transport system ATP-binding protein [Thermoproteota archaeon]